MLRPGLEEMLREVVADPTAIEYLLLAKDTRGRWQCSGRRQGNSNSFTVHVDDDPCESLYGCLSQALRVATLGEHPLFETEPDDDDGSDLI